MHSHSLGVHVPLLAMALLLVLPPLDPTWTWPSVSRPRCLCPAAAPVLVLPSGLSPPQFWLFQPLSGLSNLCALLSTPSCLFLLPVWQGELLAQGNMPLGSPLVFM